MATEDCLIDVSEKILTLTLNRPDKLNALTYDMHDAIVDALDRADRDDGIRAIIITGAGRGFCAGTDLSSGGLSRMTGGATATPARAEAVQQDNLPQEDIPRDKGARVTLRIFNSNKPVIGAINGVAAGMGAAIALPMDFRIGTPAARWSFPYARRGITPESCSSWFLPRLIGIARALEWMETGRTVSAEEAQQAGLLNQIVEPDQLLERSRALATEITLNSSPLGVVFTRRILWQGMVAGHPMISHRYESRGLHCMGQTGDPREGVKAFLEKRAPEFPASAWNDLPGDFPWWDEVEY